MPPMRTAGLLLALLLALAQAGCAKPVRINIHVLPAEPATLDVRLTKGKGAAPKPDTCQTPCSVEIAPDTTTEVTLRAPGYYPAILELSYQNVLAGPAHGAESGTLVVPLQKREVPAE